LFHHLSSFWSSGLENTRCEGNLAQVFLKKLGAASVCDEEEQEKKNKTISGIASDGIFL
jgi:hypothetical protein